MRTLVWFSAGAASAVAAKLTLAVEPEAIIYYIDPGSEHEDSRRFLDDAEAWFGHPIIRLKSDRYADTWDVWEKRRFLVGPTGALCTAELKKRLRYQVQLPDDRQVFGYTADKKEQARAARFRNENPGVELVTPLIEKGLTKEDCLAIVDRAGLELPAMYRLGYRNNNCVGCVKGGMGYWNKIRVDFPAVYDRMALLERDIGHSINKDDGGPVWLDEMAPDRGDYPNEPAPDCSLLCAIAEDEL